MNVLMIGSLKVMPIVMALLNTIRFITMQTIINVLALSSFAISASVVGGGAYLYLNKDSIVENVKEQVINAMKALQENISKIEAPKLRN